MKLIALLAIAAALGATLWAADDPASVLARILAQKGTITSAELAKVEDASAEDRVKILAGILRQKGVIDESDLAKISIPAQSVARTTEAQASGLAGPSSAVSPSDAAPTTVAASSPNAASAPEEAVPKQPIEANTDKHVPVTFYGTLLFNAGFNTAGVNLEDAPSIVAKPGSAADAQDQSFWASPRQTRFGLRLDPTEVAGAQLTGDFEIDAYSTSAPFPDGINMGLFRLRLAYGRLDWHNVALEVGQDWSIFAPLNPSSIAMYAVAEFNGSGNPWARLPQVRLELKHTLSESNRLLYQVAASDPDVGDYDSTFSGTHAPGAGELGRMPAIESRLAWTISGHDRDFTFGFSGRYGHGKNVGTVGTATLVQPVDSWGAAVDYTVPFTKAFNLTGEAYIGRALGIYDVEVGESVGAVGTLGGHGVLSRGGWAQLQYKLTRQWQFNTGYGIDNPNAHDLAVGSRDRNQNYFGNVFFILNPNVEFSLEYRRLITAFRDQAVLTGRADQVTLSGAYLF